MLCKDSSTDYLKNLGYNVVRHPRSGITPFGVIGRMGKAVNYLGHIQYLLADPPDSFPAINSVPAADVNGKNSDALKLGVGLNILGNIIGAMGGNLGVTTSYTDAERIQFKFVDVMEDSLPLLQFGSTIKDSTVDIDHPIIEPYIEDGELLMISSIIKSNKIKVEYQKDNGVGAKVEVPVIQDIVGGNVEVETSSGSTSSVTFTGKAQLAFGFRAYRIGLDKDDGTITLKPTKPGAGFLAADIDESSFEPSLLTDDGLLDM